MLMAELTSPDMEVRKKCLHIALAMVTSRNVEDVVLFLKKQLTRTLDGDYEKVKPNCSCHGSVLTCLHDRTPNIANF